MRVWATAFIALTLAGPPQQGDHYELSGRKVAIYNLAGSVRVVRGTGNSVTVDIQRAGADAGKLSVKTNAIDGVPTLRVIFPSDEIASSHLRGGSTTNVRVNSEGLFYRKGGENVRIVSRNRARRDALEADADLTVRVPDGIEVEVHQGVGGIVANGSGGDLSLNSSSGGIEVVNTRGRLKIDTAAGSVTVTGAQGDLLDVNTASGGVDIDAVRTRELNIDVASGSIETRDVQAEKVHLESASGGIRVTTTTAPDLEAETASGSIRIALSGPIKRVEASSASGGVEIALPATFGGEVEMETASGGIDVDFQINIIRSRRNYLRGTIGTGDARVSLSTASGDVRLLER
jgi:lia operon protein LiaG